MLMEPGLDVCSWPVRDGKGKRVTRGSLAGGRVARNLKPNRRPMIYQELAKEKNGRTEVEGTARGEPTKGRKIG
jgi:hypothetical protein